MSEKKLHTVFGVDPASGPGELVRATFTGAGELVHLETWPERWDEERARALREQLAGLDFSRQYLGQLPSERGIQSDDPCIYYRIGEPAGDCESDGHYLCSRCVERAPLEPEEEPDGPAARAR